MNDTPTPGTALKDALALVEFGPCRGSGHPADWLKVASPVCRYCADGEDVNLAAARIIRDSLLEREREKNAAIKERDEARKIAFELNQCAAAFLGWHSETMTTEQREIILAAMLAHNAMTAQKDGGE